MNSKELIQYFKSLGIDVHTTTKARGHHGFFLKNRIDISKNLSESEKTSTLIHEFAHYIHSKLEPDINKNGGTLEILFKTSDTEIKTELLNVTHFVDENSLCKKLEYHKQLVKDEIKKQEQIIKKHYPKFLRTKRFREFEKYIKKSDAKYLLKFDRIKLIRGFWKKDTKIYSTDTIEIDFPDMPEPFAAYIRLKSYQKKQSRISARINKNKKYYLKPTELFARYVQGLFSDKESVERIAPNTTERFYKLLKEGYYFELSTLCRTYLHI